MDEKRSEDKKKKKQNHTQGFLSKLDVWILLVLVLILVAVAVPVTSHYLQLGKAREVLTSAKTVKLAIQATAYDYYAKEQKLEDSSSRNGLADGAEEKVLTLAGSQGQIWYVDFNTDTMELKELNYTQNGYSAIYKNAGADGKGWNVYRLDHLIKH